QPSVGLVVDPHAPLFLDHLALVREGVLVDAQRGHPIRFEPQGQRQVLRRHRLPENRLVLGRERIALAAVRRDVGRGGRRQHVLPSLEDQVYEEVRKSSTAGLLFLRTHVVRKIHGNERRRVTLGELEGQPVGQRRNVVLQLRRSNRR